MVAGRSLIKGDAPQVPNAPDSEKASSAANKALGPGALAISSSRSRTKGTHSAVLPFRSRLYIFPQCFRWPGFRASVVGAAAVWQPDGSAPQGPYPVLGARVCHPPWTLSDRCPRGSPRCISNTHTRGKWPIMESGDSWTALVGSRLNASGPSLSRRVGNPYAGRDSGSPGGMPILMQEAPLHGMCS